MHIDLAPRHLQMVQTILQQHLPGQEVWLFGSRADGTAKPNSDIDLCIVNNKALDAQARANLKLAFSESNIPFVVDIVERAATSAQFFERIQAQQTFDLLHGAKLSDILTKNRSQA